MLKPLFVVLTLMGLPAQAEQVASWGQPDEINSTVNLTMINQGQHVADLVYNNVLTTFTDSYMKFTFQIDGKTFTGNIFNANLVEPDVLTIWVPEGFEAIPPTISVEEYSEGKIEIWLNQPMM